MCVIAWMGDHLCCCSLVRDGMSLPGLSLAVDGQKVAQIVSNMSVDALDLSEALKEFGFYLFGNLFA